jgi:siroheme synthase-like protein
MRYYPVFLDLRDAPVLVVGAGKVGLRKARGAREAGARVTVVAPEGEAAMTSVANEWLRREFEPADVAGMRLVFAATADRSVNRRVAELARAAGAWVNVADSREECSFLVPARVNTPSAQIAISTSGDDPHRARQLREQLEQFLASAC